jgi:hypothetical protein
MTGTEPWRRLDDPEFGARAKRFRWDPPAIAVNMDLISFDWRVADDHPGSHRHGSRFAATRLPNC